MKERIGFVGLGLMGAPMAANLLAAGYEVVAYNRSPEKAAPLVEAGAVAADSPREVAAAASTVITMLPDSPDVERVVAGEDGLLTGAAAGALLIDMSTIDPAVSRALAARAAEQGVASLDAPVSGGEVGARAATLSIMVGGEAADLERARPVFEVLGASVTHCGPAGAGQVVKACNQIVVAAGIEALAEALLLGAGGGVEPAAVLAALAGGLAGSKVLEVKGPQLSEREFSPGFRSELHLKDIRIALAAGAAEGLELPAAALAERLLAALVQSGRGGLDHTALLLAVEELGGG